MKEIPLREEIARLLRMSMPSYEREDMDEHLYIVYPNDIGLITDRIYRLIRDIEEKKPYTRNDFKFPTPL